MNLVLVFGCGLIGTAILRFLEWNRFSEISRWKTPWTDTRLLQQQINQMAEMVASQSSGKPRRVHVIWSAGTGGFASSEADLESEKGAFGLALGFFDELAREGNAVFHFVSSAGGLFEGQVMVDEQSEPVPRRPYGRMKKQQEELCAFTGSLKSRSVRIYRPSTLYGAHDFTHRSGLVSHLVWNALRNVPTILEANLHALRDYVFVDDVARYIVQNVQLVETEGATLDHLVSGKPSSIFEIAGRITRLIGRKVLCQYSDAMGNDSNITFSPHLLPHDWCPSSLDYGLAAVLRETNKSYLSDTPLGFIR